MARKIKKGKTRKEKIKNLTLSFISYSEIEKLSSQERVNKIMDIILKNRIVILQGKLKPEEETSLITSTMALVGRIKNFKGIEIASISGSYEEAFLAKVRSGIARVLIGSRDALTIIGPANIVKEIKKDPSKIELMLKR